MAKENSLFVQSSLSSAGFVANSAKSLWNPTQLLVWSGLNWDLVIGTISITDRRICKFIALARVPRKPISANRGLNIANRRINFIPLLDSVPESTINLNLGIN